MSNSINIEQQLAEIARKFDLENDLIHFLLLIGIQESGQGFREFSKDEKTELIELGGATVLAPYGYYQEVETNSPVPYYVANPDELLPEGYERDLLLKKGIVEYFNQKNIQS